MNLIKLLVLLFGIVLFLPTAALSQNLNFKRKPAIVRAPVKVEIKATQAVNCKAGLYWWGIPRKTYGVVWLDICKADKTSCSGGMTIRNDGADYSFRPNMSMAGKNLVMKMYTHDRKYIGYSNTFFVDGMLPQCCPDGEKLPPCN